MQSLCKFFVALGLASSIASSPVPDDDAASGGSGNGGGNSAISAFISKERPISLQGIVDNIGPNGKYSSGASSGIVIASPSTVNPNYLYTWTRDSALTIKVLVDELIAGNRGLEQTVKNYIHAMAVEQTLTNPSGNFQSGSGLGEPKFLVDIEPFLGAWGRPQRDGPALRAVALMDYVEYLLASKQKDTAKNVVWPVIANDLAYVGQYWNNTGYDLWEEVPGSSFFTLQSQYRSLVQGGILARVLGLKCDACESQAPQILCFLQSFWNGKTVVANINTDVKRTGYDANTLIGAITNFDITGSCTDGTFQPCNSKILASHKLLVDSFRGLYGVNKGRTAGKAAAVGRYPEDVYYGGNPWYLCTLAAAETLYDAMAQWRAQRQLTVDQTSLAFFKDLYPSVRATTYRSNDRDFSSIMSAVQTYADGFVGVVQQYISSNGTISEQFQRDQGYALSAYRLTWSFDSFVSMAERRAGQYPVPWGARLAGNKVPSKCMASSAQGTYVPAVAAGAPNASTACTVPVTFNLNASTYYGENMYIEGNSTDLGSWNPANSYGMSATGYTAQRHLWSITIYLPAASTQSYNYFRLESDGSRIFESTNRTLTVPACGSKGYTEEDAWVGTCSTAPNCT